MDLIDTIRDDEGLKKRLYVYEALVQSKPVDVGGGVKVRRIQLAYNILDLSEKVQFILECPDGELRHLAVDLRFLGGCTSLQSLVLRALQLH